MIIKFCALLADSYQCSFSLELVSGCTWPSCSCNNVLSESKHPARSHLSVSTIFMSLLSISFIVSFAFASVVLKQNYDNGKLSRLQAYFRKFFIHEFTSHPVTYLGCVFLYLQQTEIQTMSGWDIFIFRRPRSLLFLLSRRQRHNKTEWCNE